MNIFNLINKKEKELTLAKDEIYKLSRRNITNKRKFKKRLEKINRKYNLFGDVERITSILKNIP